MGKASTRQQVRAQLRQLAKSSQEDTARLVTDSVALADGMLHLTSTLLQAQRAGEIFDRARIDALAATLQETSATLASLRAQFNIPSVVGSDDRSTH